MKTRNSHKELPWLYKESDFERELPIAHYLDEYNSIGRHPFWRDYARLVQCPAFRRLKGKTQLFPGYDSDFFRCRLTHSLEVGQIGKSIANNINRQIEKYLENKNIAHEPNRFINTDLIEFSCYAHDLGHPPFGHQGEAELNNLMSEHGGFEGNAQTLRILSRIEKKYLKIIEGTDTHVLDGFTDKGDDLRAGLSITYRALASILKYDNKIELKQQQSKIKEGIIQKGYYYTEQELVETIKNKVVGDKECKNFKTIECSIMDIADDIAYSIYDLEDAFKAGFTHPYRLYAEEGAVLDKVAKKIRDLGYKNDREDFKNCDIQTVRAVILKYLPFTQEHGPLQSQPLEILRNSIYVAENGYERNKLTTKFVSDCIKDVELVTDMEHPALWDVRFKTTERLLAIEILKRITYQFQISSAKLKAIEYRGRKIVRDIFTVLVDEDIEGWQFLPGDVRSIYEKAALNQDPDLKYRVISDFISGMTDNYALEYHNRLYSTTITSIHKEI